MKEDEKDILTELVSKTNLKNVSQQHCKIVNLLKI